LAVIALLIYTIVAFAVFKIGISISAVLLVGIFLILGLTVSAWFGIFAGLSYIILMLLGGFDEGYFLYYEDVDLCRRAKELGFRIQRNKSVVFLHHGGRSHAEETGKQKKAYFHSQDRYIRKHYGPSWGWLFRILRVFRSFFLLKLC
jgi:GT2 family glycosyltransferase